MINVGIVCEYNPFHKGHLEQIRLIRSMFDETVNIISIMSGNYVQRGDPAICPKDVRTKAALICGIDLVIELPFPYSSSSANNFAYSAISILDKLGCVDYLVFGSECGNLSTLSVCANRLLSDEFEAEMNRHLKNNKSISYACVRENAYYNLYGEHLTEKPNDILGIEYLISLLKLNSKIKPLTYRRELPYSASVARKLIIEGTDENAMLPECVSELLLSANHVTWQNYTNTIIPFMRLADAKRLSEIADMNFDLASRLIKCAHKAKTAEEYFNLASNKTYTDARIRRTTLFSLFSVTDEMIKTAPQSVNMLGCSSKGREVLKVIGKTSTIPVVSRRPHENTQTYDFSLSADRIYELLGGLNYEFYKLQPIIL